MGQRWMTRFQSDHAFASLDRHELPHLAIGACRLAVDASGADDEATLDALHALEQCDRDPHLAAEMHELAARHDQAAWDAQDAEVYDVFFRRARAVSALAFALAGEPDEAIYEAAHAVGSPDELVSHLRG